jgi:hypothetical protein
MFIRATAEFRDPGLEFRDFPEVMRRLSHVVEPLERRYPEFHRTGWRLLGDTLELARLFPVFDEEGPSRVGLAVLEQQFKSERERSYVGIWSGQESARVRPTLACDVGPPEQVHSLHVELRGALDEIDAQLLLDVFRPVLDQFDPLWIQVYPFGYSKHKVFADKPGVAWMLYLPLEITAQQVPEAAALVPMAGRDGRRRGTVVLSVVDEVFDGQDPRHIEAAANIDIRMVDQDLMPCYSDLWPAA